MTVLRELVEKDGWIDIEPATEDDPEKVIGHYDGKEIQIATPYTPEEEDLDSHPDEPHIHYSGGYVVEHRRQDGKEQVKITERDINPDRDTYETTIRQNEKGYYELTIPKSQIQDIGFDVVEETTRTINKGTEEDPNYVEQEISRGIKVETDVKWENGRPVFYIQRADPDEVGKNIRSIQHKSFTNEETGREYTQFFMYFYRSLVAMMDLAGSTVTWHVDEENDRLVATPHQYANLNLEEAPIASKQYKELDPEKREIKFYEFEEYEQARLRFNEAQSRALGYLTPERKAKIMDNREKIAFLMESGPSGFTVVVHTAPDKLPDDRVTEINRSTVNVHNWQPEFESLEINRLIRYENPVQETNRSPEEVGEWVLGEGASKKKKWSVGQDVRKKAKRAGNQFITTLPKEAAHAFDLLGEPVYWWPVRDTDEYYGTGELMLVGIPLRYLQSLVSEEKQVESGSEVEA